MGFDFSRAGGAGGKVRRSPLQFSRSGNVYGVPQTGITSAEGLLNNSITLSKSGFGAFSSYTGTTSTGTLSIGSTYWIDFAGWHPYNALVDKLVINGKTINPPNPKNTVGGGLIDWVDVYGYGLEMKLYMTSATFIHLIPMLARTIVTTGGLIKWPPSLSGKSVYRGAPQL